MQEFFLRENSRVVPQIKALDVPFDGMKTDLRYDVWLKHGGREKFYFLRPEQLWCENFLLTENSRAVPQIKALDVPFDGVKTVLRYAVCIKHGGREKFYFLSPE